MVVMTVMSGCGDALSVCGRELSEGIGGWSCVRGVRGCEGARVRGCEGARVRVCEGVRVRVRVRV